jgi:hypothetical protein
LSKKASLESLDINQTLDIAKVALCKGFQGIKEYDVKSITLGEGGVLIYYIPKVENKVAIYSDICQIMAFITSFAGEELKKMGAYSIGVEAMKGGKTYSDNIYIVSTINVAEEIGKGNIVYWLKNSIVNEPYTAQKEVLLLVEGLTEINAYPVLFKSMGYPITAHRIKMFPYSEQNLKTVLSILEFKKECYYLVCDKDKSAEIMNLDRGDCFEAGSYHILEKGEFEDYIEPDILVKILEKINPGIGVTIEYIEAHRKKGKSTSKIIQDYYYQFGERYKFPGKPKLGKEIAHFWAHNGIPEEITDIIIRVMNIS